MADINWKKVFEVKKLLPQFSYGHYQDLARQVGVSNAFVSHVKTGYYDRKIQAIIDIFLKGLIEDYGDKEEAREDRDAALMMLCATRIGFDVEMLSWFSGLPLDKCKVWYQRLVDNGIWDGQKWYLESIDDPDFLQIEFILDSLVASGKVIRRDDGAQGSDGPKFQSAPQEQDQNTQREAEPEAPDPKRGDPES